MLLIFLLNEGFVKDKCSIFLYKAKELRNSKLPNIKGYLVIMSSLKVIFNIPKVLKCTPQNTVIKRIRTGFSIDREPCRLSLLWNRPRLLLLFIAIMVMVILTIYAFLTNISFAYALVWISTLFDSAKTVVAIHCDCSDGKFNCLCSACSCCICSGASGSSVRDH